MSVTLPYPTYTAFSPLTVHSDTAHNTPHAGLLSNDVALKSAVDTLQTNVTALQAIPPTSLTFISPTVGYEQNYGTWASSTNPTEWWFASSTTNHPGSLVWHTINYPAAISSSANSVKIRWVVLAGNSIVYARMRCANITDQPVLSAVTPNSSNNCSSVNDMEIPYYSGRTLDVCVFYYLGGTGPTYGVKMFWIGYRI